MMDSDALDYLDYELEQWIGRLAIDWAIPVVDAVRHVAGREIEDRLAAYPRLAAAVGRSPIHLPELREAVHCKPLSERFLAIRLSEFLDHDAATVVGELLSDFPESDLHAAQRINHFMDRLQHRGFSTPEGTFDAAGAALFASTILTAALPRRFVDFRQGRWKAFADELGCDLFSSTGKSYGEILVAAGEFAATLATTETFSRYWPTGEPLWVLSGICWRAHSPHGEARPKGAPLFRYEEDFEEGAIDLRLHFVRERNTGLVRKAKAVRREKDPLLHCDVCGFSFVKTYGPIGDGFVEAHHTRPLDSLKAGSKTRIEDLAMVCANCHRMLHAGSECRTIEEVKALIARR